MSKPVLYLFNGKVCSFGNAVLGFTPQPPPDPMAPVQIGDQIWMSKNLAIDDGGEGITTRTINYGQGDVVEYYYTWDAAVRVAASVSGWHLPSYAEFATLAEYVGYSNGAKLKSTYGWYNDQNGTDDYGFAAFPAYGDYRSDADFWTSTNYRNEYAYYLGLSTGGAIMSGYYTYKTTGFSVRLIKDS